MNRIFKLIRDEFIILNQDPSKNESLDFKIKVATINNFISFLKFTCHISCRRVGQEGIALLVL